MKQTLTCIVVWCLVIEMCALFFLASSGWGQHPRWVCHFSEPLLADVRGCVSVLFFIWYSMTNTNNIFHTFVHTFVRDVTVTNHAWPCTCPYLTECNVCQQFTEFGSVEYTFPWKRAVVSVLFTNTAQISVQTKKGVAIWSKLLSKSC